MDRLLVGEVDVLGGLIPERITHQKDVAGLQRLFPTRPKHGLPRFLVHLDPCLASRLVLRFVLGELPQTRGR
jgi:hypothetical protein